MRSACLALLFACGQSEDRPAASATYAERVKEAVVSWGVGVVARIRLAKIDDVSDFELSVDEYYATPEYTRQAIEPLRLLVAHDVATGTERARLAELLIHSRPKPVDDASYREGLDEINEGLAIDTNCHGLDRLVQWSRAVDIEASVRRAMIECTMSTYHGTWIKQLAESDTQASGEAACDLVVKDAFASPMLEKKCIRSGRTTWKVDLARARERRR